MTAASPTNSAVSRSPFLGQYAPFPDRQSPRYLLMLAYCPRDMSISPREGARVCIVVSTGLYGKSRYTARSDEIQLQLQGLPS